MKKISIIVGLLLVALAMFLVIMPTPDIISIGPSPERKVEIEKTRLSGWQAGTKTWEIKAEKIWFGQDKNLAYFSNISDGTFYDKQKAAVVNGLKCNGGYMIFEPLQIYLKDGVRAEISEQGGDKMILATSQLEFNHGRIFFPFDVALASAKEQVTGKRMTYDLENKEANISGNVQIKLDKKTASAGQVTLSGDTYLLKENVVFIDSGRKVECAQLQWSRAGQRADISGLQKLSTKEMQIAGSTAVIEPARDTAEINGKVSIVRNNDKIQGSKAVIRSGKLEMSGGIKLETNQLEKYADKVRANDHSPQRAIITGEKLDYDPSKNLTIIEGQVFVKQGDNEAKADLVHYFDKAKMIRMEKNVFMKQTDQWLQCQKVKVDIAKEEFISEGAVKARIVIEK
ncbi:MAG: LPS export ABC transporter periplasmic protein LptC [Candidatus Margulisiibacteriota bacterium]|jgi:LPS export ABC transporter protein LptC